MNTKQRIKALQKEVKKSPFADDKWLELALLYLQNKMYAEALEAADFSLTIKPEDNIAAVIKGSIMATCGDGEAAQEGLALLEGFKRQHPDDLGIELLLGLGYSMNNQKEETQKWSDNIIDKSIQMYEKAEEEGTENEFSVQMGIFHIQMCRAQKNFDEAIQTLDKQLKNSPDDPFLYILYGGTLTEAGRTKEADLWFQKAIYYADEHPCKEQLLQSLGVEYFNVGLYQRAYDMLLTIRDEAEHKMSVPTLACCCLELGLRDAYMNYLVEMENNSIMDIHHAFRNHIPVNLEANETFDFLRKIYDRCNP